MQITQFHSESLHLLALLLPSFNNNTISLLLPGGSCSPLALLVHLLNLLMSVGDPPPLVLSFLQPLSVHPQPGLDRE